MGNELFSHYSIEKTPFLTGGYLNLWKIYRGTHKERKQDVCVFVFEKKNLEKFPKHERETMLNVLKKEATSLMKYKHPSILGIVETLIEDKNTIGFVTERFSYTLTSWIETLNPSKLEIKLMITELCKVICFLHDDAHVIHTNFNPDVIFIDKDNKIKISGMGFAINDPPLSGGEAFIANTCVPNLKYSAPEIVYDSKAYYASDVFSVGVIIYSMLKYHRGEKDRELIRLSANSIDAYKSSYSTIESRLSVMPFEPDDNSAIYKAVVKDFSMRPGIKEFIEHQWFNDPKLKAMVFVENLAANDMNKNVEFLQKFPKIVGMFEEKLIVKRFLPCLLTALKNELLINACLPSIFAICEMQNLKISFSSNIWPKLKELFGMKSIPAASLYFLLSKMAFIADKISNSEFSNNFLNIICKALDCKVVKIQTMVIKNLEIVTKKIDSLSFRNNLYPRLIQIALSSNSTSFRVDILKALQKLYSLLDQSIINDSLLNNLEKIRKADNSSEICIAITLIYEDIAKIVNIESIAYKIIPNLISILVSGQISKTNFNNIMNLVHTYLDRIRTVREKDLTDENGNKIGLSGPSISVNDNFASFDNMTQTNKGSSTSTGNSDDFLSSFFSNESKPSSTANANNNTNKGIPINPMPISDINQNTNSNAFDLNALNKPQNNTTNLFEGLNTNNSSSNSGINFGFTSNSSSTPSTINIQKPSMNKNTNTNTNKNTNIDLFSNMNIGKPQTSNVNQPQMNDLFSRNQTYNNPITSNAKKDDFLNNLLKDLPSSTNQGKTNRNNSMSNSNTNQMGDFEFISDSSSNMGGFNQNSLDFLSGSKSNNTSSNLNTNYNFNMTQIQNKDIGSISNLNTYSFGNNTQQSSNLGSFSLNLNQNSNMNMNMNLGGTSFNNNNNNNNNLFSNLNINNQQTNNNNTNFDFINF